jgi:hypothetical protein
MEPIENATKADTTPGTSPKATLPQQERTEQMQFLLQVTLANADKFEELGGKAEVVQMTMNGGPALVIVLYGVRLDPDKGAVVV